MEESSPRTLVRQWVREQIEGQTEVRLPDLTDAAAEHFSRDRAFTKRFLKQALYEWVYESARLVIRDTRGGKEPILLGDELVTQEEVAQRAKGLRTKWEIFVEKAGDRHVSLMAMTRVDLLGAAELRRKQAQTSLNYARLFEALAARIEDGETVADRFTPDAVEHLYQSVLGTRAGQQPPQINQTERAAA